MTTDKPENGLKRKPTRYSSVLLQRAGESSVSSNVVILSDEFDKYASDVDALLAQKERALVIAAKGIDGLRALLAAKDAEIERLTTECDGLHEIWTQAHEELAVAQPLAEIGRLAVTTHRKKSTPTTQELGRLHLASYDAMIAAIDAYLAAQRETEVKP